MAEEGKGGIRESLMAATDGLGEPDLEGVRRRAMKSDRRGRLQGMIIGVVVAGVTFAALASLFGVGLVRPHGQRHARTAAGSCGPTLPLPLEGKLLLQQGTVGELDEGATIMTLGDGLDVRAISPNGCQVVALSGSVSNGPGAQNLVEVTLDSTGAPGSPVGLLTAPSGQALQAPIAWSHDGSLITYTVGASLDASTFCVLSLASKATQCYPSLGTVYSADWSPGDTQLVLGFSEGNGIQVLDRSTGTVTTIVTPDRADVVKVATDAGLGPVTGLQFVDPRWSASGRFIAAMAFVQNSGGWAGALPLVFNAQGNLVAQGHSSFDLRNLAWSPTTDILAYATGSLTPPDQTPRTPWAAYLLDPTTGGDQQVLSTENVPNLPGASDPYIIDLAWSPSGRWLALAGRDEVRFVDSYQTTTMIQMSPYNASATAKLVGWGP